MKNSIQGNYLKKELYELIKTDESIFDFIQAGSLDGLWYWDIENPENEWMNPKFWTVLGYNPDEMPHKASAWQDIINENDLKTATDNFNKHCENPNHPYDQIVRYTHKNGSTVWIHCRGFAIRDKDGKAKRMLGAHHDITDVKQAEQALKESETFLNETGEIAKIGGWKMDLVNQKLIWTKEVYRIHEVPDDYQPELEKGIDFYDDKSKLIIQEAVDEAIKFGKPYDIELGINTAKGNHITVRTIGRVHRNEAGAIDYINGTFQDITERKEAENNLLKNKTILEEAEKISNIGSYEYDIPKNELTLSEGFQKIHGVNKNVLKMDELMPTAHPDDRERIKTALDNAFNNIAPYDLEHSIIRQTDKEHRIIKTAGKVIFDSNGKPSKMYGFVDDITDRKQAENELKFQNVLLKTQQEVAPDGILIVDDNDKIISFNQRFSEIWGIPDSIMALQSSEKAMQYVLPKLIDPDEFAQRIHDLYENKQEKSYEEISLTDGKILERFSFPLIGSGDEYFGRIWYYRDITERKRAHLLLQEKSEEIAAQNEDLNQANLKLIAAKEKAEESEENLRFLFENMAQGVVYHKPTGDIIRANEAAARILGLSLDQLYRKTSVDPRWKSIHEDGTEYPGETHPVMVTIKTKKPVRNSIMGVFIPEKNVYSWININSIPQFNDKNELTQVVVTFEDITEIRKAKEKLEESEEKFRLIHENSSMGIASATLDFKIISANPAFCNMLGYSESELLGKTLQEYTHPETLEHNILMLKKLIEGKIPHFQLEKKFIRKDGHTIYGLLNATIIKNSNNEPLYFLGNVQDITEIKNATEKLEEANATKDRFISILGHDLRSPFNTLLGFSDLLVKKIDRYDKEKIKTFAETINKTAKQTFNLLNNLLEWSRSQRDEIPFNPQTTNLYLLINETYMLLNESAKAKEISIELDIPEEITAKVDSEMIKTIIRNLLSNAIKFTSEQGKISVSASKKPEFIQIEISDTGTGMSPETINSLFKIGKTVSRPGTKGERGTGFGLLLCKEFIDKHKGEIWAESEAGKGSDFKFTLPTTGGGEKV